MKLEKVVKAGNSFSGSKPSRKDIGKVVHLLREQRECRSESDRDWFDAALCGAKPGMMTRGWMPSNNEVSCKKCLSLKDKLEALKESDIVQISCKFIQGNGQFYQVKPMYNYKFSGYIGYAVDFTKEGIYLNFGQDFEGNDSIEFIPTNDLIHLAILFCRPFEPIVKH